MRNMTRGDVVAGGLTVQCLIVEEDVGPPKAFKNAPFDHPPRKRLSSKRMSQARSVRMTRSWAGAERAVTSAVRIGQASGENSC